MLWTRRVIEAWILTILVTLLFYTFKDVVGGLEKGWIGKHRLVVSQVSRLAMQSAKVAGRWMDRDG
jgi:hypothetical protein